MQFKKNLQKPYCVSLPENQIRGIQYFKRTVPDQNLNKQIEDFIATIVPSISEDP